MNKTNLIKTAQNALESKLFASNIYGMILQAVSKFCRIKIEAATSYIEPLEKEFLLFANLVDKYTVMELLLMAEVKTPKITIEEEVKPIVEKMMKKPYQIKMQTLTLHRHKSMQPLEAIQFEAGMQIDDSISFYMTNLETNETQIIEKYNYGKRLGQPFISIANKNRSTVYIFRNEDERCLLLSLLKTFTNEDNLHFMEYFLTQYLPINDSQNESKKESKKKSKR